MRRRSVAAGAAGELATIATRLDYYGKLAREELMNRGLSGDGRWVGFAKAGEVLGV